MSGIPKPDSRIRRVMQALVVKGDMTQREYVKTIGSFCDTDEQLQNLSKELRRRGFVERIMRVTPAAGAGE
jgi:phage terminase small subunit